MNKQNDQPGEILAFFVRGEGLRKIGAGIKINIAQRASTKSHMERGGHRLKPIEVQIVFKSSLYVDDKSSHKFHH